VHFTIYMYLYLYSYRRETARQLRMYAQLTHCFSAVAELLVSIITESYNCQVPTNFIMIADSIGIILS